jgi:hypothetical protein
MPVKGVSAILRHMTLHTVKRTGESAPADHVTGAKDPEHFGR